jgi:hypothetical protein
MKRTGTPLARPAEQARVKNTLGRDQHEMAGFVALVVHGRSSGAALWPLRVEGNHSVNLLPEQTDCGHRSGASKTRSPW